MARAFSHVDAAALDGFGDLGAAGDVFAPGRGVMGFMRRRGGAEKIKERVRAKAQRREGIVLAEKPPCNPRVRMTRRRIERASLRRNRTPLRLCAFARNSISFFLRVLRASASIPFSYTAARRYIRAGSFTSSIPPPVFPSGTVFPSLYFIN
jgi:hypothetical protein